MNSSEMSLSRVFPARESATKLPLMERFVKKKKKERKKEEKKGGRGRKEKSRRRKTDYAVTVTCLCVEVRKYISRPTDQRRSD